jgi:hypothetical protein
MKVFLCLILFKSSAAHRREEKKTVSQLTVTAAKYIFKITLERVFVMLRKFVDPLNRRLKIRRLKIRRLKIRRLKIHRLKICRLKIRLPTK